MTATANVSIHRSQFPDAVRRDLLESLRTRRVNHKFHYDSVKQANKWLALHQAHSPSRNDADCAATYDRIFAEAAARIKSRRVHVIGLGCGGGQKDARLLKRLKSRGREVFYTPSDVSVAMTLVARQAALKILPGQNCFPFVCDLATADDLPSVLATRHPSPVTRLITFFGMIPNFEPDKILPKLGALVRRNDFLLFSANLAPGPGYAAGVKKILPQYDNPLTRDWLLTFLLDLGVERGDGRLKFSVENGAQGLKRVVAQFQFKRSRQIEVDENNFTFKAGQSIRLFFSYRYTPALVERMLARKKLVILDSWVTKSQEEGVFLVKRR